MPKMTLFNNYSSSPNGLWVSLMGYICIDSETTRARGIIIVNYVALHSVRILRDLESTSLILFSSQALCSFFDHVVFQSWKYPRGSCNFCLTCACAQVVLRSMAFDYDVQPLLRTLIFSTRVCMKRKRLLDRPEYPIYNLGICLLWSFAI